VSININGSAEELPDDPRVSLLDFLREHLRLPGTKKGCDQGACGACTVLADGERILSCLALAVAYDGRSVTTIEGLGAGGALTPLQRAFIAEDGFQCGYCTPGQVVSAVGMLQEFARGGPSAVTRGTGAAGLDRAEVAERMSGNLCRCAAYVNIVRAVQQAAAPAADGQRPTGSEAAR
jgi:xanthine dehydrogenase YagT iron-sulfur-binding subunit